MKVYKLFLAILFAIGFTACITDGEKYNNLWSLGVGEDLPDFQVTLSDGTNISTDDLADKTAIIVLFNTECDDCRRELPELQKVYTETSDYTVWIAISREENESSVEKFWGTNKLTIPYSAQSDRRIYELFAGSGIPRLYISQHQTIKATFGPDKLPDKEQLIAAINNIAR